MVLRMASHGCAGSVSDPLPGVAPACRPARSSCVQLPLGRSGQSCDRRIDEFILEVTKSGLSWGNTSPETTICQPFSSFLS